MPRAKTKIPLGLRITQVAVVVKDLGETMKKYHEIMGWGPWSVYKYEPPLLHHTTVRGKPVDYTMLGAEVHCDPIDFEILQPLQGPSIYREFLEEKGGGLHHVAGVKASGNVREALADFKKNGVDILMSGIYGNAEFYYMDTDPVLKMMVEIVSDHSISMKPAYVYP